MERSQAVHYAINSMKIEGFSFTSDEQKTLSLIAENKLSPEVLRQEAASFDASMRVLFPSKFGKGDD